MRTPRALLLLLLLFVIISGVVIKGASVYAQTEEEIAQQKSQKQRELDAIMKEISTTASSKQSISTKISELKKDKEKLEALVASMNADLSSLESASKDQEAQLADLAKKHSLQQALFYVESQKSLLITLFETADLARLLDKLLFYNVQEKLLSNEREYLLTQQTALAERKSSIANEQKQLQASLSDVNQKIADLENQQAQLAAALAKNYAQRNSLVSDISNLSKAAQAILNQKANSVQPPSGGSGSGAGGGSTAPPAVTPNPSGAISILVGGSLLQRTNNIVRVRSANNEITLKGAWTTEYFGVIEFNKNSGIFAINELPLDQYLYGLGEMPSSWHSEALKVQAVAGRSYAVYKMQRGGYGAFDLYDSVRDQDYVGTSKIKGASGNNWKSAVDSTTKEVASHNGSIIQALYSAETGGHTLASNESPSFGGYRDYLQAKPDRYQDAEGNWKPYGNGSLSYWLKQTHTNTMALMTDYLNGAIYYDIHKTVKTTGEQSASALASALGANSIQNKIGAIDKVEQIYDQGGKTIVENTKQTSFIEVTGAKGMMRISGVGFKTSYNVRSPGNNSLWSSLYDIKKVSSEDWQMWSRGYGHRVGMSQYGAQGRAQAGQSYKSILSYYYNGANVVQYDIGRNVRIALSKVGSRVMTVTSRAEIQISDGNSVIKTVPANTEIKIEYN